MRKKKKVGKSIVEIHTICVTFESSKGEKKIKIETIFLLTNDFPFYFKVFFHIQHYIYMF